MVEFHFGACNNWLVHGRSALAHWLPHMFDSIVRSLDRHQNYFLHVSGYLYRLWIYAGVCGCNRSANEFYAILIKFQCKQYFGTYSKAFLFIVGLFLPLALNAFWMHSLRLFIPFKEMNLIRGDLCTKQIDFDCCRAVEKNEKKKTFILYWTCSASLCNSFQAFLSFLISSAEHILLCVHFRRMRNNWKD